MPSSTRRTQVVRHLVSDRWTAFACRALALSLVLYAVLRPENYSLLPNWLDPVFYTGYATNLDDLIVGVGQQHYFISRWSQYLPNYAFSRLLGPIAGRLVWRLVLSTGILTAAWRLGRRWKWTIAQEVLAGTVLVTMPMFVRAFFTDYSEYAVVSYGLLLILLCLRIRQSPWSVAAIGVLVGLLVVANPASLTVLIAPAAVAIWFGAGTYRGRLAITAGIGAVAIATLLAGLLWFRWRYGIHNVYQPTIDFLRHQPGPDALRSPRHEWLWQFTWLYGPPIVMLAYVGIARVRKIRLDRTERIALGLCAFQYAYQWIDQFIRKGDGLEVSYYWSFMYPAFGVLLVIGIGRATSGARSRVVLLIAVMWVALLAFGLPDSLRLPDGAWFFLLAAAVVGAAVVVGVRSAPAGAAIVLGLLAWMHLAPPAYDPSAYHPYNVSPRYDLLYRQAGNLSERTLDEIVWFERQMDTVPFDAYTAFAPMAALSGTVSGVYAPHIDGRLLDPASGTATMIQRALTGHPGGVPVVIALYGPPDEVGLLAEQFDLQTNFGPPVLDNTHAGGLGFRLVVLSAMPQDLFPLTWQGNQLPLLVGVAPETYAVAERGDRTGIFSYGPYIPLEPGHYRVTLQYSASDASPAAIGTFDVSSPVLGSVREAPIVGTGGESRSLTIDFTVDATTVWEFRTSRDVRSALTVESITLERVSP